MTSTTSTRIETTSQSVYYTEHLTLQITGKAKRHQLRIIVRADSYREQSFGLVERHDGTKWHELVSVKGVSLKVDGKAVVYGRLTDVAKARAFAADRNSLVVLAEEVL